MRRDQALLAEALRAVFSGQLVKCEWRALAGEANVYSPRVDIAVGPFATDRPYETEYDELARRHHHVLRRLRQSFVGNVQEFGGSDDIPRLDRMYQRNRNARCFLAIGSKVAAPGNTSWAALSTPWLLDA